MITRANSIGRSVRWALLILLCLIAVGAVLRRAYALLAASGGPTRAPQLAALDAAFASRPALTFVHIIPALLFVVMLPFWFSRRMREQHAGAHRRITGALFVIGAIIGLTAIPMSMRPIGGINESAATLLFDSLFLFSLGRAFVLWRRGETIRHREWMTRAVAVLLGIATTRPVMGIFFATAKLTHLEPQQFFGTAFWIGFTSTYIAGEMYIRTRFHGRDAALPQD